MPQLSTQLELAQHTWESPRRNTLATTARQTGHGLKKMESGSRQAEALMSMGGSGWYRVSGIYPAPAVD